jgi:hypothetical protein
MAVSEQYAMQRSFYFMSAQAPTKFDDGYAIEAPRIRKLIRLISERGHEIGFHGSYRFLSESAQTKLEVERLLGVLYEEGFASPYKGWRRQHYLRWGARNTWEVWDAAGLMYDSSLAFTDCAGFRCETCYQYPTDTVKSRRRLSLGVRPLVVMETTSLSSQYMGLFLEETYEYICKPGAECKELDGKFTYLWHNGSLSSRHEKQLYTRVVSKLMRQ